MFAQRMEADEVKKPVKASAPAEDLLANTKKEPSLKAKPAKASAPSDDLPAAATPTAPALLAAQAEIEALKMENAKLQIEALKRENAKLLAESKESFVKGKSVKASAPSDDLPEVKIEIVPLTADDADPASSSP